MLQGVFHGSTNRERTLQPVHAKAIAQAFAPASWENLLEWGQIEHWLGDMQSCNDNPERVRVFLDALRPILKQEITSERLCGSRTIRDLYRLADAIKHGPLQERLAVMQQAMPIHVLQIRRTGAITACLEAFTILSGGLSPPRMRLFSLDYWKQYLS